MHFHDQRMQRLVTAGLLPERAGQPAKVWAHISFADLIALDGSSALQQQWTAGLSARWAAHRAAASVGGGDGAAWLDGDAATAMACDAAVAPVVLGDVNYAVLDDLVRLCAELARLNHAEATGSEEEHQSPTLGAGREVAHRDGEPGFQREGGELGLPRAGAVAAVDAKPLMTRAASATSGG